MTAVIEKAILKDLRRLKALIPDCWALCKLFAGTRRAAEAESAVYQTIHASVNNYEEYGEMFSFNEIVGDSGCGLVDNSTAFAMLLNRGYFMEGKHDGKDTIIVTQKLVDFLDEFFAKSS